MRKENPIVRFVINKVQHYDHEKYWEMRNEVINPNSRKPNLIRYIYLLRIKKMDSFHNASMGTDLGRGAHFLKPPKFPHGLNGIVVSYYANIGINCNLFQRVTIAEKDHKAATIGNNCIIGAGAVIIGDIIIGDNVIIGANSVVTKDIPSNSTVAGVPAKLIATSN